MSKIMTQSSCLIIAGEKSGEEHAMSFFLDLKMKNPQIHFYGVGGDELASNGVELLYHLNQFSSWGISEVIAKIPFYIKAEKNILHEVSLRQTKVAILVDFQTFNLKLAKKLKKLGVNILYYVAPQAWAWKSWRVRPLSKAIHTLFTIIPFEKKWFQSRGVQRVYSVQHPVLLRFDADIKNQINKINQKVYNSWKEEIVLLFLPGSRNFEVSNLLPRFIEVASILKKSFSVRTLLVKSESVAQDLFFPWLKHIDEILPSHELPKALVRSHFALAASGTVTLTCALYQVPTVVCYASSLFNAYCFFNFVDYKGPISLANIVSEENVFPELLQDSATSFNILKELKKWLEDEEKYKSLKNALSLTAAKLEGELGNVSDYMSQVIRESYSKIKTL